MNIIEQICREICATRGMDSSGWHLFVDRVKDHVDIHAALMRVNLGLSTSLTSRGDETETEETPV